MNILTIDIGSSCTKWALHDGTDWVMNDSISDITRLEFLILPSTPDAIVVASVGSSNQLFHVDILASQYQIEPIHVVAQPSAYGVINGYDRPETLGADRWAALIAASQRRIGPTLVIDAGTAVTVDCLDEVGVFRGGSIMPGVSTMRHALVEHTANLTLEIGNWATTPTNTADAILTGCIDAIVGTIEKNWHRLSKTMPNLSAIITGGDATILLPHLQIPVYHAQHLVHEGLRHIGLVHLSEALCESS